MGHGFIHTKKGHGKQLIVWANGSDVEFKAASIEWSERKSDHGERLYFLRWEQWIKSCHWNKMRTLIMG